MKIKGIMLITLMLLVILTIGTVSASDENITDGLTVEEDSSDMISVNADSEALEGEDVGLSVDCPKNFHSLKDEDYEDYEENEITIYLADDNKGKVSVFVDGKKQYTGVFDDWENYHDLGCGWKYGKHTLKLSFSGDEKYDSSSVSTDFYYTYLEVDYINFDLTDSYYKKYGEGLIIDSPKTMDSKVYVDGKLVFNANMKTRQVIPLSNLTVGEHTYKIVTSGNGKKYVAHTVEGVFTRKVIPTVTNPELIVASDDKSFKFELPSDADGDLKILVNEVDANVSLKNGKAVLALKDLETGSYDLTVQYANDTKYEDFEDYYNLNIIPNPNFSITTSGDIYGKTVKIMFKGVKNLSGEISIYLENNDYVEASGRYENGTSTIYMDLPKQGLNKCRWSFMPEDVYADNGITGNFNTYAPSITATDFKKDYTSKKKFKVRIKGFDNKYVGAGKTVKFEFTEYFYSYSQKGATTTKTVKTDKDGYATVNFDIPGTYKVKVKLGKTAVTKKYIVNSIVKINSVCKKNPGTVSVTVTSKTIKFSATLKKVDGKVLKGKKVKFTLYDNLYGNNKKVKTYTVKTNSKGVATKIFKKSPVKLTPEVLAGGGGFYVEVKYLNDIQYASFSIYSKSPFRYYFIWAK